MLNYDEWIITNKNGTYSSSTVSFMNTRTYHGLFVKNMNNSFERYVLLSKLFEEILIDNNIYNLDTNQYNDIYIYPDGYKYLINYNKFPVPEFNYQINNIKIKKRIILDPYNDFLKIRYDFSGKIKNFKLTPLIAFRSFYNTVNNDNIKYNIKNGNNYLNINYNNTNLNIEYSGKFNGNPLWYYNFTYFIDKERGSGYKENLFSPGNIEFNNINSLEINIYSGVKNNIDFNTLLNRYLNLLSDINDKNIKKLVNISTYFLTGNNIIAGYYWFGAWARDTMISLPGNVLIPKKFGLAKKILENYINLGIPMKTNFNSNDVSEDVSLWFIYAMKKYYDYTEDINFIKNNINYMKKLINYYLNENDLHKIYNGFIILKKGHLTWMDGKYNDVVFTPRNGGAIEINALWYNALMTMKYFYDKLNLNFDSVYGNTINLLKNNFKNYYLKDGRFMDTIYPDDTSFRPNFIFAFSLPFNILDNFNDYKNDVDNELLTKYGLRTLSIMDKNFKPVYIGDQYSRDSAYHNGTVWPWLVGPYITASVRSGYNKNKLYDYFKNLFSMEYVPEIFDGLNPDKPKGCIIQSWSYAELIRSYYEDIKNNINIK